MPSVHPFLKRLRIEFSRRFSAWLLHSYRRPIGLFAVLVIVPMVILFGVTYRMNVSLWRQRTLHNLGVAARLGAEIVSETLESTLDFEHLLAGEPTFVEAVAAGDAAQMVQSLREAMRHVRRADGAVVTDLNGTIVAAHPSRSGQVGSIAPGREVLPELGSGEGGSRVTGVYLREGPGIEKVVGVVVPVAQGRRVVGLLQIQHRIESIKDWLQKIRVEPEGFLYVVDQFDQLVVFPYQVAAGKPLVVSDWPPVAYPVTPEGGSLVFTSDRTGKRWLAAVALVPEIGWRVVAVQPEAAAFQTLLRVFCSLGLLVLVLVILLALVGWRWLKVHAFSLRLLQQNTETLKQLHQAKLLERGRRPLTGGGAGPS